MNCKKALISTLVLFCMSYGFAQYKMQSIPIQTRWSALVSPNNALTEYPRPQMVRKEWKNLNGLWEYFVTDSSHAVPSPANSGIRMTGEILVPFPIESALSGVKKPLLPSQYLWYRRTIEFTPKPHSKTLLHFGAVDYRATVFINGKEIGTHEGGYTEFSFDVSALLKKGSNEIIVKVWDPTEQGVGSHGKQVLNPQNIYYTPSSGIWQTVWMETVPATYIQSLELTPDVDGAALQVKVTSATQCQAIILVKDGETIVNRYTTQTNTDAEVSIPQPKLWSPADPFLYDVIIQMKKGKTIVDEVRSYFGMRKISIAKDEKGYDRINLNNKPYFNLGTLDQGFWPDGLYTAPTDAALRYDIEAIKAMGFNMIRKHIKVEPARWYYHADKLGMLVWQDFVNPNQGLPQGAKAAFERDLQQTAQQLHNYPCIVAYTIFNEKWGQYDQQRITEWVKKMEPTRLINGHSGEYLYVNEQLRSPSPNAYVSADITDVHSYPDPMNSIRMPGKAQVLGEFGGIGVFIPDHQWLSGSAWGYVQEKVAGLRSKYKIMNQHLQLLQREGLSASIYTQPFDVEGEQNGLMTYDREVVKIPFEELRRIHRPLAPEGGKVPEVVAKNADVKELSEYSRILQEYIDGRLDPARLKDAILYASEAGDKRGAMMLGKAYVGTLKMPLTDEEIKTVGQYTKTTTDAGFGLMRDNADVFKKVLGDRSYTTMMMNIIYNGEMEPRINQGVSWADIEAATKKYGPPAEEMLLRAKTIAFLNSQDWENFVPVVRLYLERYGANVKEAERKVFEENLKNHAR